MMDYQVFYHQLTAPFRRYPWLIKILKFINRLIVCLVYCSFLGILIEAGMKKLSLLLWIIVVAASGFILLSLVRRLINAPRPYEQYQIQPLIYRAKHGESFPSRHVFSATLIGMCALRLSVVWGAILLIFAAFLAIVRVIAGIHFPRDVVVGFLAGLAWGFLLFLS